MKASGPSSLLPWIVHRGDWKGLRQAFSPLWSYSQGAWADVSVRDLLTGPAGVKVDGPLARGLWPPVGGKLCRRVVKGKVLRIDGPFRTQGFLSLTALRAEGCGLPLCGNAYKVSVTGLAL